MDIISVIVVVLVVGVLWWAVNALAAAFGLPAPIVVVLQVLVVLFGLVYILRALGVSTHVLG